MDPIIILEWLAVVALALYLFDKYIPPKLNRETTWKAVVCFIVTLIALLWLLWVVISVVRGVRL